MWDRYLSLGSRFLKIEHEFCSFFIIILCKQVCFIRSCECSLLVKSFASTCWSSVFESPLMRMLILLGNRQESYLLSIPRPLFHRGFESRSGQEPVFFIEEPVHFYLGCRIRRCVGLTFNIMHVINSILYRSLLWSRRRTRRRRRRRCLDATFTGAMEEVCTIYKLQRKLYWPASCSCIRFFIMI